MFQPVTLHIDPVPPSTNQYRLPLTQYHHISTSTASYWPSTTKYQPLPTYILVARGLQTFAQSTLGLVFCWFCFTIPIDLMSQVYLFIFIKIFVVYCTWTLTERLPLRKVVSWMSEERRRGRIQETLKFAILWPLNFQETLPYLVSTFRLLWPISLPNKIIFTLLL